MSGKVSFFNEGINYRLQRKIRIKHWIFDVITANMKIPGDINFIFCDDTYLSELNLSYLKHTTLTDIITFDYTANGIISGDIYISIDRVKENALLYSNNFPDELNRVMIHGVLHLLGNKDKKPKDKAMMRNKEDECLILLQALGK
jgi:probable rRNA maturation factor